MNPTRRAHPSHDHHDEARELRRLLQEARKKLYATRVALSNLLSVAENVDPSNIEDHHVRMLWDGNIEQADAVLDGERPDGKGEYGSLTDEEMSALDGGGGSS